MPKNPKVTWTHNGRDRVLRPDKHAPTIDTGERCPVCAGCDVLVAHDIRQTVIFRPADRDAAIAHLRSKGAEAWEAPAGNEPTLHLRAQDVRHGEYTNTATAVCTRCRSHLGTLTVQYDTIFGRTEDRLILSGAYGIVISA